MVYNIKNKSIERVMRFMALQDYSKMVYVPHNRKNIKLLGFIRIESLIEAAIFMAIMSLLVIVVIPFTKIATIICMIFVVVLSLILLVGWRGFTYGELIVNKFKLKNVYKELHMKRIGYEGYRIREATGSGRNTKETGKKRRKEKKERS